MVRPETPIVNAARRKTRQDEGRIAIAGSGGSALTMEESSIYEKERLRLAGACVLRRKVQVRPRYSRSSRSNDSIEVVSVGRAAGICCNW